MAVGAVVARILTQYSDKGSKSARKDIAKLGKNIDAFSKKASRAFGIAAAASAAFAVKFAMDSAKAAIEAQAQQSRLRNILLTTNGATEGQIEILNEQAKALERVGVVSAGTISVVQSQLATFDLQAKTIAALTPAVLDYVTAEKGATASADQFKSATNGLAQALNGNFGALSRAGFSLDEATKKQIANGTETERTAAIVRELTGTYGGFNKALRNTTEGQLIAFTNAMNDLRETVGVALLPVIEKFTQMLQNQLIPQLTKFANANREQLVAGFENASKALFKLLLVAIAFGNWISNNLTLVKNLAIVFGALFVVSKVVAFGVAIGTLITLFKSLGIAAGAAAIATSFATGGISAIGGAAGAATIAAALGVGALATKNAIDVLNKDKKPKPSAGRRRDGSKAGESSSLPGLSGLDKNMKGSLDELLRGYNKAADSINKKEEDSKKKQLSAVQKMYNLKLKELGLVETTADIEKLATANAIRANLNRQKALSGSRTIGVGGGSKLYMPKSGVNVVVNAGNVVGSKDALIEMVKDGLETLYRRRGGSGFAVL